MLDSGFWIPDSGFWILDSGFWILDSGFRIPDSGFCILHSAFWILDSAFWILDSAFPVRHLPAPDFRPTPGTPLRHQANSLDSGFRIPDSLRFPDLPEQLVIERPARWLIRPRIQVTYGDDSHGFSSMPFHICLHTHPPWRGTKIAPRQVPLLPPPWRASKRHHRRDASSWRPRRLRHPGAL